METHKPISRHPGLQPLSRDHHNGLLLCWKLRMGFARKVSPVRILRYASWFYEKHLQPHFRMEEEHIFPILGLDHDLVRMAISQHRRLERLFAKGDLQSLVEVEKVLKDHIRLEERELFNEIQKVATAEELQLIAELHNEEDFIENSRDEFWN